MAISRRGLLEFAAASPSAAAVAVLGGPAQAQGQRAGGAPGTGGNVGGAGDLNAYPFKLPSYKAGDSINLGQGPDQIDLYLASNPARTPQTNNLVVAINGVAVIAPNFEVKGFAGMSITGSMHLALKGPWGKNPKVEIIGVAPGGITELWMNSATLNFATSLVANGGYDSRGGLSENSIQVFNTGGRNILTLTIAQPVSGNKPASAAPNTNTATASMISGALINGSPAVPNTLASLLAAVPANGTLQLPAGRFTGSGPINKPGVKVLGDPVGKTIIDCKNFRPDQDKAIFVVGAPGAHFKDLTVCNAAISDALGANAAGFRAADGAHYTLENIEAFNNQNGELDGVANVTHINCYFHDNGVPPTSSARGYVHDVYINGNANSVVTVTGGKYTNSLGGHAFKCRAGKLNMKGALLQPGSDGSCLDFPDGGTANLTDVRFVRPPGSDDHNVITFAMESNKNAAAGMACNLNGCSLADPSGNALLQGGNGASLTLTGSNTFKGPQASLTIQGFAKVSGAFAKGG